jgi:hypothetical protein
MKFDAVKTSGTTAIGGKPHNALMVLTNIQDLGLRQTILNGIIFKIE